MKKEQAETKLKPTLGLTRRSITGVLCLAVISLICARAPAQNLFAVGVDSGGGFTGSIEKFTPNGVRSIFASGLTTPFNLACDSEGNLFVADAGDENAGSGAVYKFTPTGVRTTFASGLVWPFQLAFDSGGSLFVADGGDPWDLVEGAVYKFTPSGLRSTLASDITPGALAIDSADNLFVGESHWEQQ